MMDCSMRVSECGIVELLWKLEKEELKAALMESSPKKGGDRRLTMTMQVDKEMGGGGVDGNGV